MNREIIAGETIVHKNEAKAILITQMDKRGRVTFGVGTTHPGTPFMMAVETPNEDGETPDYTSIPLTLNEVSELGANLSALAALHNAGVSIDERSTEMRKQALAPRPPVPPHPGDRSHGLQMVEREPGK